MAPLDPNAQDHRFAVSLSLVEQAIRALLVAIGEDPCRDGLKDTPSRVARFWKEFIDYDAGNCTAAFQHVKTDQMIVVSGLRVWSLCEHHLLPFSCDITAGYIARGKVLGLSKFARIAHSVSHRLQIQERIVHQIADSVQHLTGANDVAVISKGEHLCMTMRGIKTQGTMATSVMRGSFRHSPEARAEFMELARG